MGSKTDAVITLIICVPVLIGLGIALVKLVGGLGIGIWKIGHTIKLMLTQKGAAEAYGIISDAAINGEVPQWAYEAAAAKLREGGASEQLINEILMDATSDAKYEAGRSRRKISRARDRMRDYDMESLRASARGDYAAAETAQYYSDIEKGRIQREADKLNL